LRLGIKKEDRVSVQLPNCPEFVYFLYALARIGAVMNPINSPLRHREVEYIVGHAGSVAMVIPSEFRRFDFTQMMAELAPKLPQLKHIIVTGERMPSGMVSLQEMLEQRLEEEYPPDYLQQFRPDSNDVALFIYTSGTTGFPKGVMHTYNTLVASARCICDSLDFDKDGNDVNFVFPPYAHFGGYCCGPWASAIYGSTLLIQDIFDPEEAQRLIEQERVTRFTAVPAFLVSLMDVLDPSQHDLSSPKAFIVGSDITPSEVLKRFVVDLGYGSSNMYALAEVAPVTYVRLKEPLEVALTTVGSAAPGMELRVIDDKGQDVPFGVSGEVICRGPCMFVGYYKDPVKTKESFTEDGWFLTGDRGILSQEGKLTILGRIKDLIIRGGENIAPAEIEELLLFHPKVANVGVVGMPDRRLRERVCAYVIPKPGEKITLEELVSFLADKGVAKFKFPERLEIVDSLPLTPTGKVRRFLLRDDIAKKLQAEGIV
jgi:acyl-CoA synthetase (AMP-forming)/AMP-acid ligase II